MSVAAFRALRLAEDAADITGSKEGIGRCRASMHAVRQFDLRALADEGVKVGLKLRSLQPNDLEPMVGFTFHFKGTGIHEILSLERAIGAAWSWGFQIPEVTPRGPGTYLFTPLDIDAIDELGLTNEQMFYLNWTTPYRAKLRAFWDDETGFETVEEFIQDLKDNCEPIYECVGAGTKSASKK